MDTAYSGAALRQGHFASRPPVAGLNHDHFTPDPEPDLFNPVPDTPPAQAGTVWQGDPQPARQTSYPTLAAVPVTHRYDTPPPVPSAVPYGQAQQAMQDRLVHVHSQTNYVPDGIRLYQHWSEGQVNEYVVGRPPRDAGATIPDGPLAGLGNGKNSYDQTNGPKPEVYTGDPANVGRYRLGAKTNVFGLYENPLGKFGQDAMLHAYTGLVPALPTAKPPMTNTAPYTPNSTGTAHWAPATSWQQPRLFGLPSESAMTDYTVANGGDYTSEFEDTKGGFY